MVGGEFTEHHPGSYAAARWWQTLTEQATPSFSSSDSLCSEVRSGSQSERLTGDTTVRQDPRSYSTSVVRCLAPFCAAADCGNHSRPTEGNRAHDPLGRPRPHLVLPLCHPMVPDQALDWRGFFLCSQAPVIRTRLVAG